jgi:transposase
MGALDRLILRDDQWERLSRHIIGTEQTRGSSGRDNRMFVEAVLWVVRTGSPWRDLPDVFGHGTAPIGGSAGGAARVFGGAFSRRCRTIRTLSI